MRWLTVGTIGVVLSLSTVQDALAAPIAGTGTGVYSSAFDQPVGDEWSNTARTQSPNGEWFLGKFGNSVVSLGLTGLPSHSTVTISLDLYVIDSWDGNHGSSIGPDIWSMRVEGGDTLLRTTFTNFPTDYRQAYPEQYGVGDYAGHTGASAIGSLGYPSYAGSTSSVYHLEYTFDHSSPEVALVFADEGLQALEDESWGIDNIYVEYDAIPEPATLGLLTLGGLALLRRQR